MYRYMCKDCRHYDYCTCFHQSSSRDGWYDDCCGRFDSNIFQRETLYNDKNKQDSNEPIKECLMIWMCGILFVLCVGTLLLLWIFR